MTEATTPTESSSSTSDSTDKLHVLIEAPFGKAELANLQGGLTSHLEYALYEYLDIPKDEPLEEHIGLVTTGISHAESTKIKDWVEVHGIDVDFFSPNSLKGSLRDGVSDTQDKRLEERNKMVVNGSGSNREVDAAIILSDGSALAQDAVGSIMFAGRGDGYHILPLNYQIDQW